MNPKTKVDSLSPQSSNKADKVSSSKTKRVKESYTKRLPFSTPQKSSSNKPKKAKKKLKPLSHWLKLKNNKKETDDSEAE
ncbi:hypothetical protein TNCT_467361 [Trichonephila clavata]|uniref:Uncharacterized protein n=1 Tax=Trichonephila clavata TaxID=2740835 RepID=A0A8X6LJ63_TRICU|nr:hypothetical protein TNCT_467361 [Trichonephila clavata]